MNEITALIKGLSTSPRQLATTVIALSSSDRVICDAGRFVAADGSRNGQCLAHALEKATGATFEIAEDYRAAWAGNGFAVITGSEWTHEEQTDLDVLLDNGERLQALRLRIRDTNGHAVSLYVVHTPGKDSALPHLRKAAELALEEFARTADLSERVAPLIVGDFNMSKSDLTAASATQFIRTNFDWANREAGSPAQTACRPVGASTSFTFDFDDKIHAIAGLTTGESFSFGCAPWRAEPLRIAYTAGADHQPVYPDQGLRVPSVAHNIIAVDYTFRYDDPPECGGGEVCDNGACKRCQCAAPRPSGAACGSVDTCGRACMCESGLGCRQGKCKPCGSLAECEQSCEATFTSCMGWCEASGESGCTTRCQRDNTRCYNRCEQGQCN